MSIDRLRESIGWTHREREDIVERRHLRAFLHAIGEPEEGAVPLTFTACFLDEPPPLPAAQDYGKGWLNGGDRFEYHAPLRLGDVVRSRLRLDDVVEKGGRTGTMAILTFVTEFRRPDGELVVRHVGTRIRR
ncbi:MaoC dehydratase-like protein [Nonomuraea polychroma]|uniref:MaoC dehydratase-like protein n=1 Tax=Nonomuraea polychroma TaxID=46176 RepID=A0A438M8F5_9ACTN|nr:MaoC family dehydratase N-terminal domain-containing protein [Nonomuraea polychroma]RVX42003.1 MaoC dehydratase-like protein [Nonomuraea polychroma]